MAQRMCEDCGKPRERERWARCDQCQHGASARVRKKLAAVRGKAFSRVVVRVAREAASSRRGPDRA